MGYALFILMLIIAALMVPFSSFAFSGAVSGLRLFAQTLLPTLFPFLVCTHYLTKAGAALMTVKKNRFLSCCVFSLFTALSGIPSAAILFGRLHADGIIDEKRASFLCGTMNQTGPNFIILALSAGFYGNEKLAVLFAVSHYIPAFTLSLLFFKTSAGGTSAVPPLNPGARFSTAIAEAVTSVLRIGGTVVFFSVVHSLAKGIGLLRGTGLWGGFITGLIEMTNGLSLLSGCSSRLGESLCAFILSFGGLCVFTQSKLVFPVLRASSYFTAKLLSGVLSFLAAYILYPITSSKLAVFGSVGLDSISLTGAEARTATLICALAAAFLSVAASLLFSKLIRRK